MVRVANVKMPRLLAFARHVEMAIIGRGSQGALHYEIRHYSAGTRNLEKNPPCNAEDNLRAGLIVIEAWFRGY